MPEHNLIPKLCDIYQLEAILSNSMDIYFLLCARCLGSLAKICRVP